jgi:hypothetical protein
LSANATACCHSPSASIGAASRSNRKIVDCIYRLYYVRVTAIPLNLAGHY